MKQSASNASSSLAGRTTLIMCIVLGSLLTSCEVGVYKGFDGHLYRVPPQLLYNNQHTTPNRVPSYSYLSQVATQQQQNRMKTVPQSGVSIKKQRQQQERSKSQSKYVLPSIPLYGYHARWDTRPVKGSPNGLFWVVNPANQKSGLPPDNFWPFWSKCVYNGVYIKIFEKYDPKNRFPAIVRYD